MSGPQCCSNPPTLDPGSGVGHVEELAGFKTYVSGSLDSKLAVLFVSDIFGYEAPNLRKVADKAAAAGFYAVVPDFLYGDPYDDKSDRPLDDWTKDHEPDKAFGDAKLVIEALKSKGVSAIGAAGFCWGAKAVVGLAKDTNYIQAAVMCHPGFVTVDDIEAVKVPIAILGGELDPVTPPELVKQFDEILSANQVDHFVKIFPNCGHGWTLRYDDDDPTAVSCAEEAHKDLLEWFPKIKELKMQNKSLLP